MNVVGLGYYALIIIVVALLGIKFYRTKNKNIKETVTLILPIFVTLVPLIFSLISPERAIEVAFPDVEKYIKNSEKLEKENKELSKNIVQLQKDNTKVKEKNNLLSEKKFAELIDSEIVLDGLKIDTKNNSLAIVEENNYYHEEIVKELIGKNIQYDKEQEKIFVGNQAVNKENKIKLEDVSEILYDGNNMEKYDEEKNDNFKVAGKEYDRGFVLTSSFGSNERYALINLDGKYSKIQFDVGRVDGGYGDIEDGKIKIYLDGKVSKQEILSGQTPSTKFEIGVKKAKSLKIAINDTQQQFGFYNIILTE